MESRRRKGECAGDRGATKVPWCRCCDRADMQARRPLHNFSRSAPRGCPLRRYLGPNSCHGHICLVPKTVRDGTPAHRALHLGGRGPESRIPSPAFRLSPFAFCAGGCGISVFRCSSVSHSRAGGGSGIRYLISGFGNQPRGPKMAVPTRTMVAPSAMATSKS